MKTQTRFFVLVTLLLSLTLTAVQAQSSRAAEWKKRVADQIVTGARAETPAAAAENKAAAAAQPVERDEPELFQDRVRDFRAQQKNALAGTWDLTLTFSDGSSVKSTLNVALGRRDGEGSVLHAAEATLLLPNPTTPEQGVWEHIGGLRFIASYAGYAVDEKFEKPAGKIGFRHSLRVSVDQESFSGRAVFEVRDLEGNVVFSDTIRTEGKRQHAEAP